MTTLLRDLIEIPDRVLAGDFVLALAKGISERSTIDQYVVTEQLAGSFDRALGIIQTAVETSSSRASYLDGSFGSGKSHFMAILHAILRGDPEARGKKGLADVVAKHDSWLRGRKFLLVPFHLPDSIDSGCRDPRRLRRACAASSTRAPHCPTCTSTTNCSPTPASCGLRHR